MIGDKKAKQIARDVQTIKDLIAKTAHDVNESNVVTRLYLRELIPPADMTLIKTLGAAYKAHTQDTA